MDTKQSAAALVIHSYIDTHQRILAFVEKMSDAQLAWRLNDDSHSITFHAWHLARWADHFQASVPGMTVELGRRLKPGVEIWTAHNMASRWHWNSAELGYRETGMGMADAVATRLVFPPQADVLDYVRQTFALTIHAAAAIDDEQFGSAEQPQALTEGIWGGATVGDAVMSHLTHANRHLGMMECLLGLQGTRGTATV